MCSRPWDQVGKPPKGAWQAGRTSFLGCCNEFRPLCYFKVRVIYSLPVLQAQKSKNQGVREAVLLLKALGKLLMAAGHPRCPLACRRSTPISASVFVCPSPHVSLSLTCLSSFSCKDTSHRIQGPTPNLGWSHLEVLNFIIPAKTLGPNKVMFADLGTRTRLYLSQRHCAA